MRFIGAIQLMRKKSTIWKYSVITNKSMRSLEIVRTYTQIHLRDMHGSTRTLETCPSSSNPFSSGMRPIYGQWPINFF